MDNTNINNFADEEKRSLDQAIYNSNYYKLQLREYEEYLKYRQIWSRAILSFVIFILIFNVIFISMVGFRLWTFSDEWIARIIFLGNFAEVLGFAKILVDFLFPSKFSIKNSGKADS